MKRILFTAAAAILVAATAGCGTLPTQTADSNVDTQKVAMIDHAARTFGVRVIWIRYPQRKADPTDVVPTLGEPTGT